MNLFEFARAAAVDGGRARPGSGQRAIRVVGIGIYGTAVYVYVYTYTYTYVYGRYRYRSRASIMIRSLIIIIN